MGSAVLERWRGGRLWHGLEERSIVRRKTFALGAIDPLEAVRDLLDLDH